MRVKINQLIFSKKKTMNNFTRILFLAFLVGTLIILAQKKQSSNPEELVTQAKEFVDLLVKGGFEKAWKNFDSVMTKAMPPEKLEEVWKSLIAQVGSFKKQVGVRTQTLPEYEIVFITCKFEKASIDVKVVFNMEKQIAGLWFAPAQAAVAYKPPAYAKSDLYQEKEVKVGNGEWTLPGTLTLPKGQGPFPALVLVHGSGPQDRDETIGPNKPFRDLAWGLASLNIAVLRYEKRTKVYGRKIANSKDPITVKEEAIDDALAAVKLLHQTEGIDSKRIFVLGHSLGGTLVPRIGMLDSKIAGFIIMAGATRPLEDITLEQFNYIFSLDGILSEAEKSKLDETERAVEEIKNLKESDAPKKGKILGARAEYWLDLRGYDPAEMAKNVKQPMLILQGGRDYQVTKENFEGWKKALSSRKDVEFRFYSELNHLFIQGKVRSTPAEYQVMGHVAKRVIEDIAEWIKKVKK